MTRIIVVIDAKRKINQTIEDPRTPFELIRLITARGLAVVGAQPGRSPTPAGDSGAVVRLTRRQCEVLFGLADGMKGAQIAHRLGVSRRTVYEYINDLKERFNVRTKEEVLVLAAQYGLLNPPGEQGLFLDGGSD